MLATVEGCVLRSSRYLEETEDDASVKCRPLVEQSYTGSLQCEVAACKLREHATDGVGSSEVLKTCKVGVLSHSRDLDESYDAATVNCRPLVAQSYTCPL